VTIDLGTGDGRLPYALALKSPDRLFVGVDASAAALRARSERAVRARLENLLYVRAAVEALPCELSGVADRITVVLPWGSLLATVARPSVGLLRHVRSLCQTDATLSLILAVEDGRDRVELHRLAVPALDDAHLHGALRAGYAEAGFELTRVHRLPAAELSRWPSTWARRLAHARDRAVITIDARAGENARDP
jgi:predicted RNA methylase